MKNLKKKKVTMNNMTYMNQYSGFMHYDSTADFNRALLRFAEENHIESPNIIITPVLEFGSPICYNNRIYYELLTDGDNNLCFDGTIYSNNQIVHSERVEIPALIYMNNISSMTTYIDCQTSQYGR